jgi:hypothetical protein
MNTILRHLQQLADYELYNLSEAIDLELQRREELLADVPESARRRAIEREQSYRRRTGAMAIPIRAIGLGKMKDPRRAA